MPRRCPPALASFCRSYSLSRGLAAKRLSGRRWGGWMLDTHLYFGCPYFSRMAGRLLVTRLLAHT